MTNDEHEAAIEVPMPEGSVAPCRVCGKVPKIQVSGNKGRCECCGSFFEMLHMGTRGLFGIAELVADGWNKMMGYTGSEARNDDHH